MPKEAKYALDLLDNYGVLGNKQAIQDVLSNLT